jgi:hypothetical protein
MDIMPRLFAPCIVLLAIISAAVSAAERRTENVLLITIDGLRWQEVFGGADGRMMLDKNAEDFQALNTAFWRETPKERRETLMPFLWKTIATQGQIFGDSENNSFARVTNGLHFSYPGYHEILCGFPDARIKSNDKLPNPNVNVLEWLNGREGFKARVAASTSWDVFPSILNDERSELRHFCCIDNVAAPPGIPDAEFKMYDHHNAKTKKYLQYDTLAYYSALDQIKKHSPRVLYVAFGATDEMAHLNRYDLYLQAALLTDQRIQKLWETLQALPQYAGKTSLVIITDHGRGDGVKDWTSHKNTIEGCDRIWMAVMGPDTPAMGLRKDVNVTQGQAAATVAKLLGEDYNAAQPKAAAPLPGITK